MRRRQILVCLFIMWAVASLSGMEVAPDLRKIDPLALVSEEPAIVAAQTRVAGVRGRQPLPLPVFVHLRSGNRVFPGKIRSLGGDAVRVHARLYTGAIPRDAARYISLWPEVAYIEADRLTRPLLDVSGPVVLADVVHPPGLPGWPPPFNTDGVTGAGVFVGVVDSGLSGAHLDFHTAGQGTPLRVPHTYVSPQLPVSQSDPLTDEEGHGTHVTGIAAGNGFSSSGTYTGMAPDADILVGKTSFFTSDIVIAVDNLMTFAGNTPVAVNLSLGAPMGPHDGTSAFESGIDSLAAGPPGSRRIVAVSAGNERDKDEHFQATLPPFGLTTAPVTFAGLSSTTAEFWADGDDRYTVTATMGTETVTVPSGLSGSSAGGGITVRNAVSQPPNGATLISVFFLPVLSGDTASIQLQRTRNGGSGKVDAYIDRIDGAFSTSTETGTITEPANADAVIAVGAFNTKIGGGAGLVGDISDFSSLGPTRDGRIKPDLTAPGSLIYSARSLEASFDPIEIAPNDNYVILQGTSMSTPHVTGIAALVWQTNPALTGSQMRDRLRRTADPPTDGSQAPNNTWGTGKVNALRAVTESVASITAPKTATPGSLVALTSENSSGPFGAPITNYQWSAPGASVSPPNLDNATFQANAPDDYTVSLTITAGGVTSLPASKIIHVNTVPTAVISGPASDNTGLPVTFTGSGSSAQDVGQALTYRWVLVSRPADSSATLLPAGADNATMTADFEGLYEVGLRVDDGLDDSALVTTLFTALAVSGSGGGGGGGCAIGSRNSEDDGAASLAALLLLLGPLGMLAARRRGFRFPLHRGSTSPSPRR